MVLHFVLSYFSIFSFDKVTSKSLPLSFLLSLSFLVLWLVIRARSLVRLPLSLRILASNTAIDVYSDAIDSPYFSVANELRALGFYCRSASAPYNVLLLSWCNVVLVLVDHTRVCGFVRPHSSLHWFNVKRYLCYVWCGVVCVSFSGKRHTNMLIGSNIRFLFSVLCVHSAQAHERIKNVIKSNTPFLRRSD